MPAFLRRILCQLVGHRYMNVKDGVVFGYIVPQGQPPPPIEGTRQCQRCGLIELRA
jgi:hypothetical protein